MAKLKHDSKTSLRKSRSGTVGKIFISAFTLEGRLSNKVTLSSTELSTRPYGEKVEVRDQIEEEMKRCALPKVENYERAALFRDMLEYFDKNILIVND